MLGRVAFRTGNAPHSKSALKYQGCQEFPGPQGGTVAGNTVGATLGYAIALQGKQRVVACIGDGSF